MTAFPLTDIGNGQRFARAHGDRARWLSEEREWRIWEGTHWKAYSTDDRALALAKQIVVEVMDEARAETDDNRRSLLLKHATKTQSSASLTAMVKMAKSEMSMWSEASEFDGDPYMLNFKNGTVDLRSGELRAHDPRDRISKLIRHDYNDVATAPRWEKLVNRCVECDPSGETAKFLHRALGYTLLGSNPEQKIFFLVGPRRTGKSKIVEIIASVLGSDYAKIAGVKLITRSRWGTHHDSETWSMRDKRYVAISETDAGMDLDEAMVKMLTGAEMIAVRKLHRPSEEDVRMTATLIVGTNEEPNVERWDDALARRVVKIPSGPSLEPDEADSDLPDSIRRDETEGVLAWLVAGCVDWFEAKRRDGHGFVLPDAVQQATDEFEANNDHVADFLAQRAEVGQGFSVPLTHVNEAYLRHRGGKESGALKRRALYDRIVDYYRAHGIDVTRDNRQFHGMKLRVTDVTPAQARFAADWS